MIPRLLAFALAALAASEHAQANDGLPLVQAEMPKSWPQEHRLFAICPNTPWAEPKKQGVVQT